MRKSQFVVVLATALAVIFSTTPVASGEDTGKAFSYYDYLYQSKPEGMFYPRDTFIGFGTTAASYFGATTTNGPDNVWIAVLQPCSTEILDYCIESASWRKPGSDKWNSGSVTDWKPNRSDSVFTGTTYTSSGETQYRDFFINPDTGLPRGGHAKVWKLPGATHGGGDDYIVTASVYYYKNVPGSVTQIFAMEMKPVKFDKSTPSGTNIWPFSYGTTYNFPTNIEYQAKVRIGKFKEQVGGWFNGRILDPTIVQEGSTITLSGTPTNVLTARTGPLSCEKIKLNVIMSEMCAKRDPALDSSSKYVSTSILNSSIENALTPTAFYPNGSFAFFEPLMKPIGFTSEWNAVTWGINGSGNCQMDPGKIALASSNATLYSAFPPAWDSVEQTLAYQVGSLHLDHTGAIHKGHFNLAVPKTFAKCLWGENIVNAKATVAVTNADGTNNVATSVLSQDDQMIYFKVAGFTFSTPQIKVKLEVPKVEPTPTPSASATPTPMATIKPVPVQKTITCVKGKVLKKVKAVNPKCPSGYKKK